MTHPPFRQDLLEAASEYAEFCVLVTTAELDLPGPQIIHVNAAFTRMTGYTVQEVLGKTPRLLQGPKTDHTLLSHLRSALESDSDFIARTINYKKNGEPFELEWIISHLRDRQGRTTHYIAVQRDITHLHRAEDQLIAYDEELRTARTELLEHAERLRQNELALEQRARLTLLGEMAAGVMHDLSNALTPVFGALQSLNMIDNLPPPARRLCRSMDMTVEHAVNVLSNLKDYYHNPESQKAAPVDLVQLVNKLPEMTSARWWHADDSNRGRYNFSIRTDNELWIEGNDIELMQVLVNLVLNAIDAMPDGGRIDLSAHAHGGRAVLHISDTGIGMDQAMADSCFEPYVSGRGTGAGLGLAVCRRIVRAHDGEITLYDTPEPGATFRIELPLLAQREPGVGSWQDRQDRQDRQGSSDSDRHAAPER